MEQFIQTMKTATISPLDLLLEFKIILKDFYYADIISQPNGLILKFETGQCFSLLISEAETDSNHITE